MEEKKLNDVIKALIARYGEKQAIVAIEELSELQKELTKALRGYLDKVHLVEEVADVIFCVKQIIALYNIDPALINSMLNSKVERTIARYL